MSPALGKSLLHFIKVQGTQLDQRCLPYHQWTSERRSIGVWPYSKVLMSRVGHAAQVGNQYAENTARCINFGSQDYLGLAQRKELQEAVVEAVEEWGVHSAGSAILCGRTRLLLELEDKIRKLLGRSECIVFPTGWAAGFGVIAGLVRGEDSVVMDALSHNCLQEGARHATHHVRHFAHNDLEMMRSLLSVERDRNPAGGIFVVLESLYSMDSDSPCLRDAVRIAREFEAIVILDVAHDFGAMGERGLGLLEQVGRDDEPDVIMGSFSKTFAANGGFIACSTPVREYIAYHASSHVFSNAISPLQTAVVNRAFDLVFSEEGDALRSVLMNNIVALRSAMVSQGLEVAGIPSPIVPVFVGNEKLARLTSKHLTSHGLLANLVEFPAVARGRARFRFQVMASHEADLINSAAEIMAVCKASAEADLRLLEHVTDEVQAVVNCQNVKRGKMKLISNGMMNDRGIPACLDGLSNEQKAFIESMISKQGPEPDEYEVLAGWFDAVASEVDAGRLERAEIADFWREKTLAYFPDSLQGHVVRKPHGYAGDYEIIDLIYTQHVGRDERLRKWDLYFQQQPACKAVRNRMRYFHDLLRMRLAKNGGKHLRVLNIGSGPGRDMAEWLDAVGADAVHFDCVELDDRAIAYAKNLCAPYPGAVRFIRDNALRFRTHEKYDLVWCAGMFDYLNDGLFCRLLKRLMGFVNNHGEVVIGNFGPCNPTKAWMELFGGWQLLLRSANELFSLAAFSGLPASRVRLGSESEGVNFFLHLEP